jgi:predicted SAM-dependent methyltransferase
MSKLNYLNLGCGATFHKDWTNVDFISSGEGVIAHNLLSGIPFKDNSFDVVYHSHVLEHFPKQAAHYFIKECYRVLKPGGVLRIAIPDLEQIVKNYLMYLEQSMKQIPDAAQKYEWTMLELYDQVVRTQSGGAMIDFIKDESKGIDSFLLERNGKEVQLLMDGLRGKNVAAEQTTPTTSPRFSLSLGYRIKEKLKRWLLKEDYEKLQATHFRFGGEIHQWMYDRYSLSQLLSSNGFKKATVMTAFTSAIPNWHTFDLDGKNSLVRKPDSLFMEVVK